MIGYESAVPGSCAFGASEGQHSAFVPDFLWIPLFLLKKVDLTWRVESIEKGLDLWFGVCLKGKELEFKALISNRTFASNKTFMHSKIKICLFSDCKKHVFYYQGEIFTQRLKHYDKGVHWNI